MILSAKILLSVLCLIPAFAVWMAAINASHRARRQLPAELVLYRLNRFIRYFHTLYLLVFVMASLALGQLAFWGFGPSWLQRNLAIVFAVVCFVLLKMCYQLATYSIRQRIIGFEIQRWSAVLLTGCSNLPQAVFYGGLLAVLDAFNRNWVQTHQWLIGIVIMFVFLATALLLTELGPSIRYRRMRLERVPVAWIEIAKQAGFPRIQFYEWRTRRTKVLNAMATGLIRPKVIVADYLVDTMNAEHVQAVIRHEMGHLRKRHLWRGLVLGLAWIPVVQTVRSLMVMGHVPVGLTTTICWVGLGTYWGLFMKALSRRFEYQADAYAAQHGTEDIIGALSELRLHSHSVSSVSAFDQLWLTHPSTDNRIFRLRRDFSDPASTAFATAP